MTYKGWYAIKPNQPALVSKKIAIWVDVKKVCIVVMSSISWVNGDIRFICPKNSL